MMFYRRRASPKHRYSIIEVDYGGGGHRTRLKDQTINCCVSRVPPCPLYIKEQGGGVRPARTEGTPGGVLLPPGVGFPPFLVGIGFGKGERGEREGRGAPPPLLVLFGLGGRGARPALAASPLLRKGPLRPINLPGGSGNLPVLR